MAYELQVETRSIFGKKVKSLRQAGKIPAEIYGNKTDNSSVQIDGKRLNQVLQDAGNTNLISITVDDQEPVMALARNIQYSILKREVLHVDFYKVIMTETVAVSVPVQLIGHSDLITDEGGTLVSGLNTLDIEALPDQIPAIVEVDISVLENFSDFISVSDLSLSEGVIIHSNLDSMIATIQPPRLVTEEEQDEISEIELSEDEEVEDEDVE